VFGIDTVGDDFIVCREVLVDELLSRVGYGDVAIKLAEPPLEEDGADEGLGDVVSLTVKGVKGADIGGEPLTGMARGLPIWINRSPRVVIGLEAGAMNFTS